MDMRHHIDLARRLTEAEIIPFPTAKRDAMVAQDRHRFRLLVFAARQGDEEMPKVQMIDRLDGLSADELVHQMHNYHPEHQRGNMWVSEPMGKTTYYLRVLVGLDAPSERDLAEIEQLRQTQTDSR